MVARLGNVIYWAACGAAVLNFFYWVWLALTAHVEPTTTIIFGAIISLVVWLIGRAALYILAGK